MFFNKSVIRDLLIQTITGSVVVSKDSKLDIEKWAKAMPNFYKRRFGEGKDKTKCQCKLWVSDRIAAYDYKGELEWQR